MGPFECVMFVLSKVLMWYGASCAKTRKTLFLDAPRAHCEAGAISEMAIALKTGEGRGLVRRTLS